MFFELIGGQLSRFPFRSPEGGRSFSDPTTAILLSSLLAICASRSSPLDCVSYLAMLVSAYLNDEDAEESKRALPTYEFVAFNNLKFTNPEITPYLFFKFVSTVLDNFKWHPSITFGLPFVRV